MKSKDDTMAARLARVMETWEHIEEQATTLGSPDANAYVKRRARSLLASAAIEYARRMRRLAGVR